MIATLPRTVSQLQAVVVHTVIILAVALAVLALVRLIARRIRSVADDGDPETLTAREQRARTAADLVVNVGDIATVIIAGLMILGQFVNVTPLLASAGILALAVSFGSQTLVHDFVSGFFILLENQYAVGDIVKIGTAQGVVERVTLRVVQIRDDSGALYIIPNGQITQVTNLTRGWRRAIVDVQVPWTEVDRAQRALERLARELGEDPDWRPLLLAPPQLEGVEQISEKTATLRIAARTRPRSIDAVTRELRRRVIRAIERERLTGAVASTDATTGTKPAATPSAPLAGAAEPGVPGAPTAPPQKPAA